MVLILWLALLAFIFNFETGGSRVVLVGASRVVMVGASESAFHFSSNKVEEVGLPGARRHVFSIILFFLKNYQRFFQLCKVHVFTKLLGHILTFKKIIFHI